MIVKTLQRVDGRRDASGRAGDPVGSGADISDAPPARQ